MRFILALVLLLVMAVLTACGTPAGEDATPTAMVETGLDPVESPERVLAEETGLALEEITLLDSERVEWTNACFEAPQAGEVCAQVVTPGFRISLETPQGVYEIRTDASGEAYRILPPGEGPVVPTAILWERSGGIAGICQRLTITFEGQYVLTDCVNDHTLSTGQLPGDSWDQLSQWLETYGNFEFQSQLPEGSADMFADQYLFNGRGDRIPGIERQQEINEYLGVLATDLTSPPPSAALDSSSGIQGQALLPRAEAENVTVQEGQFTEVTIIFDTGMR